MTKLLLPTSKPKQFIFIYATNFKKKFHHKQQSLLSSRAAPLDLLRPLYFSNPWQYFLFHTIYAKTPTFCIP